VNRTAICPPRRKAFVAAALLAGLASVPGALAEDVTTDLVKTETLASGSYRGFHVSVPDGRQASFSIEATGTVDFYVIREEFYSGYTNLFSGGFVAERSKERAIDFSHTLSESGKVVVIDNAGKSTTGANPVGPVTYTLRVTYGDRWDPVVVCGIALIPIGGALAIAYIIWDSRRKARKAAIQGTPPPELPPPPPD